MANVKRSEEELRFVSAQLPASLRGALEDAAQRNDRSMSAELRVALAEHLETSLRAVETAIPPEPHGAARAGVAG